LKGEEEMLKLFTGKRKKKLNDEIDRQQVRLEGLEEDSEEYQKTLKTLKELFKLRDDLKVNISPTTIAVVGGIVQILLILNYEQANVMTSRATNFITRGRG